MWRRGFLGLKGSGGGGWLAWGGGLGACEAAFVCKVVAGHLPCPIAASRRLRPWQCAQQPGQGAVSASCRKPRKTFQPQPALPSRSPAWQHPPKRCLREEAFVGSVVAGRGDDAIAASRPSHRQPPQQQCSPTLPLRAA